ncbi:unnamed protein product [Prunus armeniaca]
MPSPGLQTTSDSIRSHDADHEKYADVNWDELEFGVVPTDYMYTMKCSKGDEFSQGHLTPYGNIELSPSAGVLNYGQGLYEGLKANRTQDGRFLLFRPELNALRMKMGAQRLCMPSPSTHQFIDSIKQTILANKRWVPPLGKGTLSLRPLLMGSGSVLGMGLAPEYTFLIFASPVGNYHKSRAALNLYVEDKLRRATPGGTGGVKSITSLPSTKDRAKGFSDVLCLDSTISASAEIRTFFICFSAIYGTVLPGITHKSIIDIALDFGYQVEERVIPEEDLLEADEAFCTGTAVVVIGAVTYQGKRVEYKTGKRTLSQKLYETLTRIQTGRLEDKKGWTMEIY